jgi:DNA topoisomerase-1
VPAKNGIAQRKGGSANGGTRLVIVESPAKAKTIAGYLGGNFVVESSIGHIRDLPGKASEVPAKYKGEEWAKLGVNVDHDFEPLYIVNADKRTQVAKLKKLMEDADELFLATDEDRPGISRRSSSPRSRCTGWSSTRSPGTRSGPPPRTRAS